MCVYNILHTKTDRRRGKKKNIHDIILISQYGQSPFFHKTKSEGFL